MNGELLGKTKGVDTFSAIRANILPLFHGFCDSINLLSQDPNTSWDQVDYFGIVKGLPEYQKAIEKLGEVRDKILGPDFIEEYKGQKYQIEERFKKSPEKMLAYTAGAYMLTHIVDSIKEDDPYKLTREYINQEPNYFWDDGVFEVDVLVNSMFVNRGSELRNSIDSRDLVYKSIANYLDNYATQYGDRSYQSGREVLGFVLSGLTPAVWDMYEKIEQGLTWEDSKIVIMGAARQNLLVGGVGKHRQGLLNGTISIAEANNATNNTKGDVTIGCIMIPRMKEMYEILQEIRKVIEGLD